MEYLVDGHPYNDTYFMELIKIRLLSKYCEKWAGDVNTISKLELYKTIKSSIGVERYVKGCPHNNNDTSQCVAGVFSRLK
jgi:coenzyme F420-reducing hydrogenase gamma subunit